MFHLYLIHTGEFAVNDIPVYKVGKTTQIPSDRFRSYPAYSSVLACIDFSHFTDAERVIISRFRKSFGKPYWKREYFFGSKEIMIDMMDSLYKETKYKIDSHCEKMEWLHFLSRENIVKICKANGIKANGKNLVDSIIAHSKQELAAEFYKNSKISPTHADIFQNCSNSFIKEVLKSFRLDVTKYKSLYDITSVNCDLLDLKFTQEMIDYYCNKMGLRKLNIEQFNNYIRYFGYNCLSVFTADQVRKITGRKKTVSKKTILIEYGVIKPVLPEPIQPQIQQTQQLPPQQIVGDLITF